MRAVIKVGTSSLTYSTGNLNIRAVERLCKVLADLKNEGDEIVLVSSGAIGMGVGKLGMKERPADVITKQAAAAVGQCELMYIYDKLFGEYNHTVAQILLTGDDLNDPERNANFSNTLSRLLSLGALPVINENDTVATNEIRVGDNDTLSALSAVASRADLLVLLSDIDGLFDQDPHQNPDARLISRVEKLDDSVFALAGVAGTQLGTGGMVTKLHAAAICMNAGIDMVITNGSRPEDLYDIFAGKSVGTYFCAGGKS